MIRTFSQVSSFSESHTFRKISPHISGQAMLVALKSWFSSGLKLGWAPFPQRQKR